MSKTHSFDKINYLLRPKKQIERKIFIDLLNKIQNFGEINLSNYFYIGMGSIFYYDFILFHKYLNISKMISIDSSLLTRRFEFNKPYSFVEFYNMKSTEFLIDYDIDGNSILWLDYDFGIIDETQNLFNSLIEEDLELVIDKAKKNDFFLITLDIKLKKFINLHDESAYRKNILSIIAPYLSPNLNNMKYINHDCFAIVVQNLIHNIIEEKIKIRKNLNFYKLFAFTYNDGTPMFTVGGVFADDNSIQEKLKEEKFISIDDSIIDIDVPILTYREKLSLDQKIEKNFSNQKIYKKDIKKIAHNLMFDLENMEESINKYLEYYKYYPQYYEGII